MKKKITYTDLLTDTERNVIQKYLGRVPTELELEYIAMIRAEQLRGRPYLETVIRLDHGAKRDYKFDGQIKINETDTMLFYGGTQVISSHGRLVLDRNYALRNQVANGVVPAALVGTLITPGDRKINCRNILKRALQNHKVGRWKVRGEVATSPTKNNGENLNHVFSIGFTKQEALLPKRELKPGTLVFVVESNANAQKADYDSLLLSLIPDIETRPWFFDKMLIDWRGLGTNIVDFLLENQTGITLYYDGSDEGDSVIVPRWHLAGKLLVFIQPGFEHELKDHCTEWDLDCKKIGCLRNDQQFIIESNSQVVISVPVDVFDFPKRALQHQIYTPEHQQSDKKSLPVVKDKNNYNKTFATLITRLTEENAILISGRKRADAITDVWEHGVVIDDGQMDTPLIMAQADNVYFCHLDPRVGGRLAISNAIRQLACRGAKPLAIALQNVLPLTDDPFASWQGMEILQGQEEAIRLLELTIASREIHLRDRVISLQVSAVGAMQHGVSPMTTGFKQKGDFISILGSHRGELGGSAYYRLIHNVFAGTPPAGDLRMDERILEVVLQGIRSGLIKSATNVSQGGLVTAIARSLVSGSEGLGARIYFSRKLRNDELLFGETQGLVVISLGEEDIMEFERICMTIGVPSTTIGRVTDDGKFTVNELINFKSTELRTFFGA